MQQLNGIMPALVTPFDKSGAVDYDVLASLVEARKKGVKLRIKTDSPKAPGSRDMTGSGAS